MRANEVATITLTPGPAIPTAFALRLFLPETINAVCKSALDGDQAAIETIFQQAARITMYCAILAADVERQEKLKPIIEKLPAVPVLRAVNKSFGSYTQGAYSQFEIGKTGPPWFQGKWDYTNATSRSMIQIVMLMIFMRDAASSHKAQGLPLDAMETVCHGLPGTQGSKKVRKAACSRWRDAFVAFVPAAHAKGWLTHGLGDSPDFAPYRNRRNNPMTGIKDQVLSFFQKHLFV